MLALLALLTVLPLSQPSPDFGQRVSVNDTFLVYGETGRVICQVTPHPGGTLSVVRWSRDGTPIYTYIPTNSPPGSAAPGGGLVGRSGYQHLSNGSSTLIIHNVVNSDGGTYQCYAEFYGPSAEDTCQVTIVRRPTTPSISTPTNPVRENDRVVLTCEPDQGTRPFTYDFQRTDGKDMRGDVNRDQGTLTIPQTNRDDQGNYACRVNNQVGSSSWSGEFRLEVDYPPESIVISGYTNGTTVYSGDDFTLACTATGGRPFATSVQWTCPGVTSGHGSETSGGRVNSFTTKVLKSWHGNQCVCSTTQRALSEPYTKRYVFTVSWPPDDPSILFTPQLPWLEGNTYSATCQVTDGGRPACTYRWYKEGQPLQGTNTISLPMEKEDNGTEIKCVVQNAHTLRPPAQTMKSKETLRVQFAPRLTLTPTERNITKKENETLVLGCEAESNPVAQATHFRWTHRRGESVDRQRQGQRTWALGQVSKDDAGTYTCEVSVPITHPVSRSLTGDKQLYFVVQFLHVRTHPASQEVTEYERLTVTCLVDAVPDDISFFQWMHNSRGEHRFLDSNTTSKTTAMLVFSQAQYYNAGTYTCRARNGVYPEMKTAEHQVTVRYTAKQPDHPAEGRRVFTKIGEDVSLSIKVDAYPSTVTFTWYFVQENNLTEITEDGVITISSKPLESTLNITNVTVSHIGNYTVHGNNGVLNGSNFIFLVIPHEPTHGVNLNLGVTAGIVSSVVLLIACIALSITIFQRRRKRKDRKETEDMSRKSKSVGSEEHQYENTGEPALYENVKDHPNRTADPAYEELSKGKTEANSGKIYVQLSKPDECELLQDKNDTTVDQTYEELQERGSLSHVNISKKDKELTYESLRKKHEDA